MSFSLAGQRLLPGLAAVLTLTTLACATRPLVLEDGPAHQATVAGNEVRFTWHAQTGRLDEMIGYRLQVATSLSFSSPLHDQVYQEPFAELILPPGTYYWRVQGRYRGMGDIVETTEWSDMKQVDGGYVQRARLITVLEPGTRPPAAAATDSPAAPAARTSAASAARSPAAAPAVAPARLPGAVAVRASDSAVVAAHGNRPSFEGIDSLGVATVQVDGREDFMLTRELVLQLHLLGRHTLLEQQLVSAGELRLPTSFVDGTGKPGELPAELARIFLLHPSQPTPMIGDAAVRLRSPDAMLVVRIGLLAMDPGALPRRPATPRPPRPDFARFGSGTRVLSASLVSVKTGIVLWTTSLYGLPEIADMELISGLVERYFR